MTEEVLELQTTPEPQEEWPDDRKTGPLQVLISQRELIASLTYRDIRARYKQSVLGIAWAILNPIAMTMVYTLVFSVFLQLKPPGGIPYPVFVFTAMLPWHFFSLTVNMGADSLVSNFSLITKIYFPREVLLVSLLLSKGVDLLLGLVVLIASYLICQVHVGWMVLWVIPIFLIQICLMLGLVLLLSSTNLFYRDVRHVVPLMMTLWMYMTPIIYQIGEVPRQFLPIYCLNPMVPIIESYKRVALLGQPPMWSYLGIAAVVSIVVLIVGYKVFKKLEPSFAEMV